MRTAFVGTSQFAAAVLERLARSPHRPQLVLTRPDRPRGRGRRPAPPPVAEASRALAIEVAQPERLEDELERIEAVAPDVICVCAYGALIREPLLSRYELLNVHPSLLPRWRGAAPIERAIMAGDTRTGVSIMRVTAGLDSGPVCGVAAEPIEAGDDYGTLSGRLQERGAELLVATLAQPRRCEEQDEAQVTYAEKIGAAERILDPARPARELELVVRALSPHVVARLDSGLRVLAAHTTGDRLEAGALEAVGGRLLFGTAAGTLELDRVQPAGGRAMDAGAYLRGHAV